MCVLYYTIETAVKPAIDWTQKQINFASTRSNEHQKRHTRKKEENHFEFHYQYKYWLYIVSEWVVPSCFWLRQHLSVQHLFARIVSDTIAQSHPHSHNMWICHRSVFTLTKTKAHFFLDRHLGCADKQHAIEKKEREIARRQHNFVFWFFLAKRHIVQTIYCVMAAAEKIGK